jgi:hypothetical protein
VAKKSVKKVKMGDEQMVTIDNVEYDVTKLTESAKAQLSSIRFVDMQLQQLNNELAVADTARIGYTKALKSELEVVGKSK